MIEAIWAGSATEEKLRWWLDQRGHQLMQTEPAAARLIFVLQPPEAGKNYRLAKMVTTAATPAQVAYFRHQRFALFGTLQPDGSIHRIAPVAPPPPRGPVQRE